MFFLTMYAFMRGVETPRTKGWLLISVVVCVLGMACKETVATAPLLVFLYDRTFVSGSFHEAWRLRGKFYCGLAGSWLLLAALMVETKGRSGSAGLGTSVSS